MNEDDKHFHDIRRAVTATVAAQPDTAETRMALVEVLLLLAVTLAEQMPRELRQHWAKAFYNYADKLAE